MEVGKKKNLSENLRTSWVVTLIRHFSAPKRLPPIPRHTHMKSSDFSSDFFPPFPPCFRFSGFAFAFVLISLIQHAVNLQRDQLIDGDVIGCLRLGLPDEFRGDAVDAHGH